MNMIMAKKGIFLSLLLCLSLSACGGQQTENPPAGQTVYVPEDVTYITGQKAVTGVCTIGDHVYLLCWGGSGTSAPKIFRFSEAEREVEEMTAFRSTLSTGNCLVTGAAAMQGRMTRFG